MNLFLTRWLMRKHKRLVRHKTRAAQVLGRLAKISPEAFPHWKLGYLP
jgi:RNA-directed DNA polymerase